MGISENDKDFVNGLIDYYISESEAYRQIAETFVPEINSVYDATFGIITGCIYSGLMQSYQNQQKSPSLEDLKEFNQIIKERSPMIKKAIIEPLSVAPTIDNQNKDTDIAPLCITPKGAETTVTTHELTAKGVEITNNPPTTLNISPKEDTIIVDGIPPKEDSTVASDSVDSDKSLATKDADVETLTDASPKVSKKDPNKDTEI